MDSLLIDANVLIALFSKKTANDDRFRIQGLVHDALKKKEKILLPAPALAEFAARASKEELDFINSGPFRIAPFDAKAAFECAAFLRSWVKDAKQTRPKAKFDFQILAIAQTNNISMMVTDDAQLVRQARAQGIPVKQIADLPIPDQFRQAELL